MKNRAKQKKEWGCSAMKWKDEELKTAGDLMKKGIEKCDTPEEAQEFMRLFKAENPYAEENIGYISGYYDTEEKQRIQEWFCVEHPIFGRTNPTPEQAFEAGVQLALEGPPSEVEL